MNTSFNQLKYKRAKLKRIAAALTISLALHSPILAPKTTKAVANYVDNHYEAAKLTGMRHLIRKEAEQQIEKGTFDRGHFIVKALTLEDVIKRTAAGEKLNFNDEWKKNKLLLEKERLMHEDINAMNVPDAVEELGKRTVDADTGVYTGGQADMLVRLKSKVPMQNCYSATLLQLAITNHPLQIETFHDHVQPVIQAKNHKWYSPYDGSIRAEPTGNVHDANKIVDFYTPEWPFGSDHPFSFPFTLKSYDGRVPMLENQKFELKSVPNSHQKIHSSTNSSYETFEHHPWTVQNDFSYADHSEKENIEDIVRLFRTKPHPEDELPKFALSDNAPIIVELDPNSLHDSHEELIKRFPDIQRKTILMARFHASAKELLGPGQIDAYLNREIFEFTSPYLDTLNGLHYLDATIKQAEEIKQQLPPDEFAELFKKLDEIADDAKKRKKEVADKIFSSKKFLQNISGAEIFMAAVADPKRASDLLNKVSKPSIISHFAWSHPRQSSPLFDYTLKEMTPHLSPDILQKIKEVRPKLK